MDANDWDRSTARRHVDAAAQLWTQRSRLDWELGLTMLTAAGIRLAEPPKVQQRRTAAENTAAPRSIRRPREEVARPSRSKTAPRN